MFKLTRLIAITAITLAGCGGGSGSSTVVPPIIPPTSTTPSWTPGTYTASAQLENFCAVPRTGIDPYSNSRYPDKAGSAMHEKLWLRSWSHETYLWYKELPDLNPANYSVQQYFNLLKTDAKTDSGADKDNFHFAQNTADYKQRTQSGVTSGYGINWHFGSLTPPRSLGILYTEPDSPAANAGIQRGAQLVSINGVDFVNDTTPQGVDLLNAALFQIQTGQSYNFVFRDTQGVETLYTLVSADVLGSPVHNVKVIDSPAGKVGYLQFNSHIAMAQEQLIKAIEQFRDQSVSELVVDLRYNGGGLLALAAQLGFMVAGENTIQGRYFEKTQFNDKNQTHDPITGRPLTPMPFYSNVIDYNRNVLTNQKLPSLVLNRVFVLATADTCSASEAFINGLRGVDLEVILIGDKTCGKPYGFYPADNCGTTYFTIQFNGVNAKGFGDYADGFQPTPAPQFSADVKGCSVADDFQHNLGDSNEAMLKTALHYMNNGSCPAQVQTASKGPGAAPQQSIAIDRHNIRYRSMLQENKINQPILPAEEQPQ